MILGSTLNLRPVLKTPSSMEIKVLFQITSQSLEGFQFDIQFRGLYQIFQYLIEAKTVAIPWQDVTSGVFKLALKYQSQHSMELLQFMVHNQLCAPKLILEIYKNITESPADEMSIRTLILLFRTSGFREILREPTMEWDLIEKYLNSNGPLVMKQSFFETILDLIVVILNIPVQGYSFTTKTLSQKTAFDEKMERVQTKLTFKAIVIPAATVAKITPKAFHLNPGDVNNSLFRLLVKTIFFETTAERNVAHTVQILLRQLEFATRLLGRLNSVMDISQSSNLMEKFLMNYESNLRALTTAFKSQISEDGGVVNKLLEYLISFLSVDYLRELKPVLESTGFLSQVAIWAFSQYVEPDENKRKVFISDDDGKSSMRNAKTRRNALVIETILRLGSVKEGILHDHWIDIGGATNVMVSFNMFKVRKVN